MSSDIGRAVDGRWVFYGIMLFNNTQSGSLSVLNNSIVLSKSTAPLNEPEYNIVLILNPTNEKHEMIIGSKGHNTNIIFYDSILSPVMLVKVNNIDVDRNKVRGSNLDIDDYGSIITLKELELKIPANDDSIIQTLCENADV